jgi:hypothetical protein
MKDWTDAEKLLYDKSRALKMQAREMRNKRLREDETRERQALHTKRLADEATARRAKVDRDARIKSALMAFMNALKKENLALLGYGMFGEKKHVLTIIDTRGTPGVAGTTSVRNGSASPTDVNVRLVSGKGFEWD